MDGPCSVVATPILAMTVITTIYMFCLFVTGKHMNSPPLTKKKKLTFTTAKCSFMTAHRIFLPNTKGSLFLAHVRASTQDGARVL